MGAPRRRASRWVSIRLKSAADVEKIRRAGELVMATFKEVEAVLAPGLVTDEINRIVGGAVQEATQAGVDLSDKADLTIGIEVRHEGTLLYGQVIPGPGGMPSRALACPRVILPVSSWRRISFSRVRMRSMLATELRFLPSISATVTNSFSSPLNPK